MTIRDLLEQVDEIVENPFSEKQKIRWINMVEADIQTQVLLIAPEGAVRYTEADLDTELLVPNAFAELYQWYLIRQIALAQEEFERANNYASVYNDVYVAYQVWVAQNINPGNGYAQQVQYYLSAYQIAVKHGYSGSEEDWLKTLQGAQGKDGASLLDLRQSVLSTEDGGENVWLATLPDGDVSLVVRNGSQGRQGPQGIPGTAGSDGAPGADGVGIASVSLASEAVDGNTYKIVLTNKASYTFIAPRGPIGPQGEPAPPGAPELDENGYLVWTEAEDGSGETGTPGVGIETIEQITTSTADNGENVWRATLTDGSTADFVVRNGSKGSQGPRGLTGSAGNDGAPGVDGVGIANIALVSISASGNTYRIYLTDETTYDFIAPAGPTGAAVSEIVQKAGSVTLNDTDGKDATLTVNWYRYGAMLIYDFLVTGAALEAHETVVFNDTGNVLPKPVSYGHDHMVTLSYGYNVASMHFSDSAPLEFSFAPWEAAGATSEFVGTYACRYGSGGTTSGGDIA